MINLLAIFVLINISYWTFSEKYIHDGSAIDGFFYGVLASSACLLLGLAAIPLGNLYSKMKSNY